MISIARFIIATSIIICGAQAHAVYGVQDAINDTLSDELKYVGKFVPRYSESGTIPMCLFRGKKVVVYSSYCIKSVTGAVSMRIHSVDPTKGSLTIYAEARDKDDITKVERDHYSDYGFSISTLDNGTFNFNGDLKFFRVWDDTLSKSPAPACIASRAFPKHCNPAHQADVDSWGTPASDFWNKPTPNWYQLINVLKSKVP